MQGTITLGRIRGIALGVNYTWLIALVLITWSLAAGFYPSDFPGWSESAYWLVATISAFLLFASVLVHELAHSFVAQHLGMRVQGINLFIFGGVSNIEGDAKSARDELLIAAVGPLSSLVLAVLIGAAFFILRDLQPQLAALLFYLATVNVLLALFNLIPGFPLDGGRVFRGIVWKITNDFRQATRIATSVGKVVAYLLIFGGLFLAFTGSFLSGIWLAFIGWFLSEGANAGYRQMTVQELLRGVHVADLMIANPLSVEADASLAEVVHEYVLRQNVRAIPVVRGDRLVGLITLGEIRAVPAEQWPDVVAGEVMTPVEQLHTVSPQDDASRAMRTLSEEDVNQLPVVENGRLAGLLSRGSLLRFFQVRDELGLQSRYRA